MPWNNTPTMEQRQKFITLAKSGRFTVTELCLEFGISRKCGHKWLVRHAEGGAAALADRSRAPHSVPLRTSEAIERLVVSERRLHPTWGPKKLRAVLERKYAMESPPAVSTLGAILKRHGMIEARRRRPGAFNVQRGELTGALRPNHVWATDFKGWFHTLAGEHCGGPAMPEEVDERCSHLRRGWYWETAGFAQKMLRMAASAVSGRKSRAYARALELRAHGT